MKVLQAYNQYRSLFNGEETVVYRTRDLLLRNGVDAPLLMRSSRDIGPGLASRAKAFFSGVYSRSAEREMRELLHREQPDVVHAHNLYPLLSPSVLAACRKAGVPTVMSVHNQNLTCPTADHLHRGGACHKCYGGREHHCVLQNCRGNLVESIGYAVRSAAARRFGLFAKNVTLFVALTEFARQWLIGAGYEPDQIVVLHNMVDQIHPPVDPAQGTYAAFAGRLSAEKDVATLVEAARRAPECEVRIAGGGPLEEQLRQDAPQNVQFVGRVPREQMAEFYRGARCLVLCSNAFEMCPLVISEAMSHGLPVVASRIGGVDELVAQGRTGLLFEPGNAGELADKLRRLWRDDDFCRRLGRRGHQKADEQFGQHAYFERLMDIYRQAISHTSPQPQGDEPELEETPPLETAVR